MGHYRIDTSKLRTSEAWRIGGLLLATATLFGKNLGGNEACQMDCEELVPLEMAELPRDARKALDSHIRAAKTLGLKLLLVYSLPRVSPGDKSYELVYSDTQKTSILTLQYSKTGESTDVSFTCQSRTYKGIDIAVLSSKKKFDPPDSCELRYCPRLSLDKAWEAHKWRFRGKSIT